MTSHIITDQLELAYKYNAAGLQLVALPEGVKGARQFWKKTIEKPQTPADIKELFGTQPVNTAIYSGPESGDFVTIDIDDKNLFSYYCLNIKGFNDIVSKTLTCKTRRGVHIGIKTDCTLENAKFINPKNPKQKGGDIIALNGYALYPRSEFSGGEYEMLFDFNNIFELDTTDKSLFDFRQAFNLKPYKEFEPLPDRLSTGIIYKNGKPYGLSQRIWQLLTQGDIEGRYPSRSEYEQAIITSCVLRGWGLETVQELFRRHRHTESKYAEKLKSNLEKKYIEICFREAVKYLEQDKTKIDREIDQLHNLVNVWNWKGQAGRTDKDLTHSLLEIARRRRSLEGFGASIRELSELTGTSEGTVFNALRRTPFISDTETNGITCTFTLKTPCEMNVQVLQSETVNTDKDVYNTPCEMNVQVLQYNFNYKNLDVFRWQGLGKTGAAIYTDLLNNGESDIKTISARARVSFKTVYNKLANLEKTGLVTVRKDGKKTILKAIPGADLKQAAEKIGTAGALTKQIKKHEKERRAYKSYIDRIKN